LIRNYYYFEACRCLFIVGDSIYGSDKLFS